MGIRERPAPPPTWQIASLFVGLVLALITGAIQIGSLKARVEDNAKRLDQVILAHVMLTERMARIEAQNVGQEQRLLVIEMHDVETRVIEGRMSERITKLETR